MKRGGALGEVRDGGCRIAGHDISLHGRENSSRARAGAQDIEFERGEGGFADVEQRRRRQAERVRDERGEIRLVADEHHAGCAR